MTQPTAKAAADTAAQAKPDTPSVAQAAHPLAGRTLRLPNGALYVVEDWWARVRPDDQDPRHPRSPGHAVYVARRRDPVPGVYGHIGSLGYILAPDELEGAEVVG